MQSASRPAPHHFFTWDGQLGAVRHFLTWLVLLVVIPFALVITAAGIYPPYDGGVVVCEDLLEEVTNDRSWSGLSTRPLRDAPGIRCDFDLRNGSQLGLDRTAWGWWTAHIAVIPGALVFAWRSLTARPFYAIVLAGILLDLWLSLWLVSNHSGFLALTIRIHVALGLSSLLLRVLDEHRRTASRAVNLTLQKKSDLGSALVLEPPCSMRIYAGHEAHRVSQLWAAVASLCLHCRSGIGAGSRRIRANRFSP